MGFPRSILADVVLAASLAAGSACAQDFPGDAVLSDPALEGSDFPAYRYHPAAPESQTVTPHTHDARNRELRAMAEQYPQLPDYLKKSLESVSSDDPGARFPSASADFDAASLRAQTLMHAKSTDGLKRVLSVMYGGASYPAGADETYEEPAAKPAPSDATGASPSAAAPEPSARVREDRIRSARDRSR